MWGFRVYDLGSFGMFKLRGLGLSGFRIVIALGGWGLKARILRFICAAMGGSLGDLQRAVWPH